MRTHILTFASLALTLASTSALAADPPPLASSAAPAVAPPKAPERTNTAEQRESRIMPRPGGWTAETVHFLTERGIPVCAHLGLTPQSVHALGGYRIQGRDEDGSFPDPAQHGY